MKMGMDFVRHQGSPGSIWPICHCTIPTGGWKQSKNPWKGAFITEKLLLTAAKWKDF